MLLGRWQQPPTRSLLRRAGARDREEAHYDDFTPLHLAAAQGDLRAVDILLAHDADPDEITRIDDFETPLEVAAAGRHVLIVDRLRPLTTRRAWEVASVADDVVDVARLMRAGTTSIRGTDMVRPR